MSAFLFGASFGGSNTTMSKVSPSAAADCTVRRMQCADTRSEQPSDAKRDITGICECSLEFTGRGTSVSRHTGN